MELAKLIKQLAAAGIEITTDGEKIKVAYDTEPSDHQWDFLRTHKRELLEALTPCRLWSLQHADGKSYQHSFCPPQNLWQLVTEWYPSAMEYAALPESPETATTPNRAGGEPMRPIRVRRSQLDECGIKRGLSADEVLHSIEPSRGDDLPEDFAIEILEDERVVDQEAGALDTPPLVIAFGRCDQCNTDDVWCFWDHTKLNGHWEPVIATCEVCKGNREPEDEKAAA